VIITAAGVSAIDTEEGQPHHSAQSIFSYSFVVSNVVATTNFVCGMYECNSKCHLHVNFVTE
jgi:hypothetical protein